MYVLPVANKGSIRFIKIKWWMRSNHGEKLQMRTRHFSTLKYYSQEEFHVAYQTAYLKNSCMCSRLVVSSMKAPTATTWDLF